jgi:hypothetical protein
MVLYTLTVTFLDNQMNQMVASIPQI